MLCDIIEDVILSSVILSRSDCNRKEGNEKEEKGSQRKVIEDVMVGERWCNFVHFEKHVCHTGFEPGAK